MILDLGHDGFSFTTFTTGFFLLPILESFLTTPTATGTMFSDELMNVVVSVIKVHART
jgi:hypothetical protein